MIRERDGALNRLHAELGSRPETDGETNGHHSSPTSPTDEQIIDLCRRARNSDKFVRLFDRGDTSGYSLDDSRADLALVSIFVFYTQDRDQIDRLFRMSRLYREEKWGRRPDYRRRTIDKALSGVREVYRTADRACLSHPGKNGHGGASGRPMNQSKDAGAVDRLRNDLMCAPAWQSEERNGETIFPPVGRLLSEVRAEQVRWLWEKRFPLGKLTIIEGDPGLGKSALLIDITARSSVGRPLPDGTPCEAGGVVICSAEDGLADTIRPRLDAAEGNPDKVLALTTVEDGYDERLLSIPEDIQIIRRAVERVDAKLLIVDPLNAFLSGKVNAHKDHDVRRGLAPLAKLAEEMGVAVVVVRHLNKADGGNPLYRGGGSIGIIGAARSALLVAKDPEDDRRRVLAPQKNNLAKPAPSLAFVLEEAPNGAVRVEWKGETAHTADSLLAAPANPKRRSAREEAMEFLRDTLAAGPVRSEEVEKAARAGKISESTLKRAKKDLGVVAKKEGGNGPWSWWLPEGKGTKEDQASKSGPLEPLDPLASTGRSLN